MCRAGVFLSSCSTSENVELLAVCRLSAKAARGVSDQFPRVDRSNLPAWRRAGGRSVLNSMHIQVFECATFSKLSFPQFLIGAGSGRADENDDFHRCCRDAAINSDSHASASVAMHSLCPSCAVLLFAVFVSALLEFSFESPV